MRRFRSLSLLLEYLGKHRARFAAGFLLLAGTNLLALTVPRLLKRAVESIQGSDRRGLLLYSAAIVLVALAQAGVRTLSRLAILGASRYVATELRDRLFGHLQLLPLSYYGRQSIGDITSRAINDMQLVRGFFGFGLMNLLNTSLIYVTAVSMMFVMDPRLTLWALAPFPLFIIAVHRLSRRIYSRTREVQEQLGALSSRAQETISGMNLIKTYAREEAESEVWNGMSREYLRRTLSLARVRGTMVPIMGIMGSVGTLVVVGLGGRAVIDGRLGLGDFVAFNAYLAMLAWPTLAFGWILNTFQRGAAAMGRISEILDEPTENRDPEPEDSPMEGSIQVRGLTFAHEGSPTGTRHLDDIRLDVPSGTTLGIIGTVGSGKSTLVGMLPRALATPPGTVFIDGEDVTAMPLDRLRRHIAVVPQEPFLFRRSIRENVRLAPVDASEADLESAVEMSCLSRDLDLFPDGLDTVVGERGVTLSGGQRQRATIARALIVKPAILILDDALSSVDAQVEHELVEHLKGLKGESTMIIVSNRVASLSWADRIIVMDGGSIIESGTHQDLMRAGGLYARIADRQSIASRLEDL